MCHLQHQALQREVGSGPCKCVNGKLLVHLVQSAYDKTLHPLDFEKAARKVKLLTSKWTASEETGLFFPLPQRWMVWPSIIIKRNLLCGLFLGFSCSI